MMERKLRGTAFGAVALGVAMAAAMIGARAQANPGQGGASGAQGAAVKTAAEQFKNIQVLKDIPAYQLQSTMDFISASLGVGCDFCHVDDAKDKDDKQNKLTARKMMLMTMEINKGHFDRPQVTCFTCHRGANDPVGTPSPISENEPPRVSQQPPPAGLPNADQLIDKYVQALGGADAIGKVTSRVEKGKIDAQGTTIPIEVYAKAPNKRISITKMQNGESYTAFDGTIGWLGGGTRPPRVMNPTETLASKMDSDIHFATDIKQSLTRLRAVRPEKIGDVEMYQVVGQSPDETPVRLYFDEKTGLLTRLVRYTPTAFGRLPTQIDYSDYRDVDGVKVPFRWTLARVNGRFTIQIDSAQQNVPIEDSKFAKPEGGTPGPGGPRH